MFNPLSVFFIYDENSKLISILYEVKNTFGEQHTYIFKTDDEKIITISSNFQPLTPSGQFEVSSFLMQLCNKSEVGRMLILAGLASDPGCEDVHVVSPSIEDTKAMEKIGLIVSKEHPSAGIIGLTGLVASIAPTYNQPAICVIAETVGTSVDTIAADRMVSFIERSFSLELGLELDLSLIHI